MEIEICQQLTLMKVSNVDMMTKGYEGKRKIPYIEAAEETPDPDEYDYYYNKIYVRDYGLEINVLSKSKT